MRKPEIILDDNYGSHQPAVFVDEWNAELEKQGFGDEIEVITTADNAVVDVLYNGPGRGELSGEALAALTERASCAWMDILDKFVPEKGCHLGYIGESQALWMIPDDWEASDYVDGEDDWYIEGKDDYVEFEADLLRFEPSRRKNLLGHAAEWGAKLEDWQVESLASIADEYGEGLKVEWGCFMCPAKLWVKDKLLVVDTSGTW